MKIKAWWPVVALAVMISWSGASVCGQDENESKSGKEREATKEEADAGPHRYWIGVALAGGDQEPLQVKSVFPDGPAAKAGLKEGDVILSLGDKEMTNVDELIAAVRENKQRKLTARVRRDGEEVTIEIKPEMRPEPPASERAVWRDLGPQIDIDTLREAIEQYSRGEGQPWERAIEMWRLRPGFVLPQGIRNPFEFPKDTTIAITRGDGDELQIHVEHDGKSFDVSDKQLDKLPLAVRPTVERMVAGSVFHIEVRPPDGPRPLVRPDGPRPAEKPRVLRPTQPPQRLEDREATAPRPNDGALDELRRDLKELRREVQALKDAAHSKDD